MNLDVMIDFFSWRLGLRRHFCFKARAPCAARLRAPLSLLRSMPVVQAPQASPHLEKIKDGTVRTISGFVPDDDGGSVLVVLKNFSRLTKLNKSGLGLNADMMFAGSSRPKKYGKLFGNVVKGVFIHLCTKKTCNSYQHAVHLGEWAYVGDGDEGGGDR